LKGKKRNIGFQFAWSGLRSAFKTERNFTIHIFCAGFVVLAGFLLGMNKIEWMILILTINAVLVSELFNTAIETLIDYLKPEVHPSAKFIKDVAAGAVLICVISSVIIGCLLFFPKILAFF
jgi:diacylglycerol kinase